MKPVLFKMPISEFCQQDPIELIIFDCDGVLIDSEILGQQVAHQEILKLGYSISLEQYIEISVGWVKEEEEKILKKRGIQLPEDFWEKVDAKILEVFSKQLQPIQGIQETLNQLQLKCCIASSSPRKRLEFSLALTQLNSFFEGVIFDKSMIEKAKPHPDIYLLAAQQLGIMPNRCLVIEDSVPGIEAGLAAGMRVWGFVGGKHCFPSYTQKIQETDIDVMFHDMCQLPKLLEGFLAVESKS